MRFIVRMSVAAIVAVLLPSVLFAQSLPLAQILPNTLVGSVDMVSSAAAGVPGNPHDAHFIAALGADQVPLTINKLIAAQLSTFPIGSSSAGFVFNFDSATGTFKPASQSFGPLFAERALTNGKGRFGFGVNYQHVECQSYEGTDLKNGALTYVLQHNDCCPNPAGTTGPEEPFFEGDLIRMSVVMSLKTDITAPFVSYGLTNRWDVGVVLPLVHVSLNPTITSTLDLISTAGITPPIHSFDGNGQLTKVTGISGAASGLGDILLRTKYRFIDFAGGGIAGGIDLRLPTGDRDNLLGTGAVQTKLSFIASTEISRLSPHVNVGYTFSSGHLSDSLTTINSQGAAAAGATQTQLASVTGTPLVDTTVPNELNYTAGFDVAAHSLLTVSADFIGRTIRDTPRFAMMPQTYQYRTSNLGPLLTTTRDTFSNISTGNLNLFMGALNAKFNIPRTTLLLTGSVLFPLNDSGLKPNVTPVVSLDYSFAK